MTMSCLSTQEHVCEREEVCECIRMNVTILLHVRTWPSLCRSLQPLIYIPASGLQYELLSGWSFVPKGFKCFRFPSKSRNTNPCSLRFAALIHKYAQPTAMPATPKPEVISPETQIQM